MSKHDRKASESKASAGVEDPKYQATEGRNVKTDGERTWTAWRAIRGPATPRLVVVGCRSRAPREPVRGAPSFPGPGVHLAQRATKAEANLGTEHEADGKEDDHRDCNDRIGS